MAPKPAWWIYKDQLDFLCYGEALWEPAPVDDACVAIGDVGFIREGRFYLLFSAGSPLGERRLGEDVPTTFEQLKVGPPTRAQPRQPGHLCTATVREIEAGLGATIPTALPLEPGANFSFELTGNHGAALVTKDLTYRKDTRLYAAFDRYTKRHYDSWVAFARDKDYGDDVQPVLVYGVDMTEDFAMVAYSYQDVSFESNLTVDAPMLISASASLRERAPPLERASDTPSLQPTGGTTSSAYSQCVFIRYYTMRSRGRLWPFPKVIRANAGPHDLGPGDNAGDTFPGLVAQSDTETADDSVEPNVVVRNMPNDMEYDSWGAVADYVFQNSNAASVLMHHRDLIGIRSAGDTDDIPSLLARHRPRIVVDESGVGRIDCQKLWRRRTSANRPTLRDIPMVPPTSPALKRLYDLDDSSPAFQDELFDVLIEDKFAQWEPNFQGEDLVWLIDYLDRALGILRPASVAFQHCLRELRHICGVNAILPSSYIVSPQLLDIGDQRVASRGSGDLYEGTLSGSKVCVKRFRTPPTDDPTEAAQTLYEPAAVWKHLEHQNVVPLLGVTSAPLQLISEWMPGGDLLEYISENPGADRIGLLCDVGIGLQFLHSCKIVHGNLKGSNVLVDLNGHARITDIGLASITQNLGFIRSGPDDGSYTAPEILDGRGGCSKESDIFSFATVMVEAFTGAVPSNGRPAYAVVVSMLERNNPPQSTTFTKELWVVMQRCWDSNPRLRPRVAEVLRALPDTMAWKRFINDSLSKEERISLATHVFSTQDQAELAESLTGEDAQNFVDAINEVLDSLVPRIRLESLRCLYDICGCRGIVPRSLIIPHRYDPSEGQRRRGEFADTWKGKYRGRDVAAKVFRVHQRTGFDLVKRNFCREVVIWRALRHPNILPLLGVTMVGTQLVMVSEWMINGTINQFVELHPEADRLELLRDATTGLIFLHDQGIAHGDPKGANILVSYHGHACWIDFGLSTIIAEKEALTSSTSARGTTRWMGPELLAPEAFGSTGGRPTRESDCYALGMVIYEVLSEQMPFHLYGTGSVLVKVLGGERPKKPKGAQGAWFTAEIWTMLELCWKRRPVDRPSSRDILRGLEGAQPPSRSSSPYVDTMDMDEERDLDFISSGPNSVSLPLSFYDTGPRTIALPTVYPESPYPTPYGHPPGVTSVIAPPKRDKSQIKPQQVNSERSRRGYVDGGWRVFNPTP